MHLKHLLLLHKHQNWRVTLNWIPSHISIPGNNKADDLAKTTKFIDRVQITVQPSLQQIKKMAKEPTHTKWHKMFIIRLRITPTQPYDIGWPQISSHRPSANKHPENWLLSYIDFILGTRPTGKCSMASLNHASTASMTHTTLYCTIRWSANTPLGYGFTSMFQMISPLRRASNWLPNWWV